MHSALAYYRVVEKKKLEACDAHQTAHGHRNRSLFVQHGLGCIFAYQNASYEQNRLAAAAGRPSTICIIIIIYAMHAQQLFLYVPFISLLLLYFTTADALLSLWPQPVVRKNCSRMIFEKNDIFIEILSVNEHRERKIERERVECKEQH